MRRKCQRALQQLKLVSQKHNEYRFDENDGGNGGDSNVKCFSKNLQNEDPGLSAVRQNIAGESESKTQESNPNLHTTSAVPSISNPRYRTLIA